MRYSRTYVITVVLLIAFVKCDSNTEVTLEIKQGVLTGLRKQTFLRDKKYYSFTGIPFAKPPLGALRFKPPVPHDGWNGILKAQDEKPTCFQFSIRRRNDEPQGFSGSEDCLYLNIYSPNLEDAAPVLVFDYNDNFKTGFNASTYSPDFFIEEGVIVVTINNRLGVFGYLTTEDDVIPANSGIRDFILGLKWIQDNIRSFGGDPTRVTVMGNRGGAAIANILLYSKKAEDLFSAVILQSGTAMETIYFDKNPREKAFLLGESLNITTDDSNTLLDKLQDVDANVLLLKEGDVFDEKAMVSAQLSIQTFSPTVENSEDAVLTALPEKANIVNDVPVLMGFNSREGLDLASHYLMEPRLIDNLKNVLFVFPIRVDYRFHRNSTVFKNGVHDVVSYYMKDGYLHYGNILEYATYVGDVLQNYALHTAAKQLVVDLNSDVFLYMFDYRGLLNENSNYISRYLRFSMEHWGATITDELCYLFLFSRIQKTYKQFKSMPSERPEFKVLKKMVRMWSNFVKSRNPTPAEDDEVLNGIQWLPMVKNGEVNYLHVTRTFRMKTNPLGKRAEIWDEFLDKYRKMAKDGFVNEEIKHSEL